MKVFALLFSRRDRHAGYTVFFDTAQRNSVTGSFVEILLPVPGTRHSAGNQWSEILVSYDPGWLCIIIYIDKFNKLNAKYYNAWHPTTHCPPILNTPWTHAHTNKLWINGDINHIPGKFTGEYPHDHPAPCRTGYLLHIDTLRWAGAIWSSSHPGDLPWCLHRCHTAGYPDEKSAGLSYTDICVDGYPVQQFHMHTCDLLVVSFSVRAHISPRG